MAGKTNRLENLMKQSALIAEAVGNGSLKLAIPSTTGDDKLLADLPPDHHAVDYIIHSAEALK